MADACASPASEEEINFIDEVTAFTSKETYKLTTNDKEFCWNSSISDLKEFIANDLKLIGK